jgi:hypothetical protein
VHVLYGFILLFPSRSRQIYIMNISIVENIVILHEILIKKYESIFEPTTGKNMKNRRYDRQFENIDIKHKYDQQ